MSFNKRKPKRFGPRFGEIMGKLCHSALTASNRKNKKKYDECVQEIYQMLDTIEQETKWSDDAKPTPVAAKSEPSKKSSGAAKKDSSRATISGRASGKARSADKGSVSTGRAGGSGVASKPTSGK